MKLLTCLLCGLLLTAAAQSKSSTTSEKDLKRFDELTEVILEGSYRERKAALEEMVKLNIDISIIQKRLKNETDPELRLALTTLVDRKVVWSKVNDNRWEKYPIAGMNDDGKPLYLVKAEVDGEIVIGKLWKGSIGHFPHNGKEVLIKDFKIWHNPAEWRPWNKDLKGMKVLGLNKAGKNIYAARGKLQQGIHIGIYVEGSDQAIIPWGGNTHSVKDFEVMVEKGTPGESSLDEAIEKFKPNIRVIDHKRGIHWPENNIVIQEGVLEIELEPLFDGLPKINEDKKIRKK